MEVPVIIIDFMVRLLLENFQSRTATDLQWWPKL